jgi:hypothetical protein
VVKIISKPFGILSFSSYISSVMRETLNPLKNMKLGLVRIQNEKLVGVQYFESKFQRELGEVVSINNVKWTVAVIGEDRNTIVDVLNGIVKKQNSIVRKENNRINRIADMRFNKILREAIERVNNY